MSGQQHQNQSQSAGNAVVGPVPTHSVGLSPDFTDPL